MATSNIVKKDVTFEFENGYTRKVTVSNFGEEETQTTQVNQFRNAIKAFNSSDVSLVSAFYGYSTTDNNQIVYPVTGIKDANVTQTIKTPIYARDSEALQRALADDSEEG